MVPVMRNRDVSIWSISSGMEEGNMSRLYRFRWAIWPGITIVAGLLIVGLVAPGILRSAVRPLTSGSSTSTAQPDHAYTTSELQTVDPGSPLGGIPAPDFTLTDQFGRSVSLHSFRGKTVVLSFDDDQCTTICPLTTQTLRLAKQALGSAGSQVVLLGVNANPLHTSVNDVKTFSVQHGMLNDWLFLTGAKTALDTVWKAYHLEVQIVNGSIDHTPAVFVIDPMGREQTLYLTSADYGVVPLEAETLANAISTTLPSHPAVVPVAHAAGNPISSLKSVARLPSLIGGTTVPLGGTSPQLVVFFASWAPDAATNLTALDTYAAAAKSGSVPPLTVVDVTSTEPSVTQAQAVVKGLASTPSYPIVMDESGRVADAYDVQDIPWIALVKNGKVIWSHDGWVPASKLEQDVTQALSH